MCGIFGIISNKAVSELLLTGIKYEQYRGYDSCGICLQEEELKIYKGLGKIDQLPEIKSSSQLGIAHTRWATHGIINLNNAHPHLSNNQKIALVHNGIIENYQTLKEDLEKLGYHFNSETDSEVIVNLLQEHHRHLPFLQALQKTINSLNGSFAIGIINQEENYLYFAKNKSSLIVGKNQENVMISSSLTKMFHLSEIYYLEDHQIGRLSKNKIEIYDANLKLVKVKYHLFRYVEQRQEINYHSHFETEIHQIEQTISLLITKHISFNNQINLPLKMNYHHFKNIHLIGCGSSYHAALIGKHLIEQFTTIPCQVSIASQFLASKFIPSYHLYILISQSGETSDTLAAFKLIKKHQGKVLSLVNEEHSSLSKMSDDVLSVSCQKEYAVATSKALCGQIFLLYLFALKLLLNSKLYQQEKYLYEINNIKNLPLEISKTLEYGQEKIKNFVEKLNGYEHLYILGNYVDYYLAMEGSLKIKELSYLHAEAYPLGELKHGPLALIDKKMMTICLSTSHHLKTLNSLNEIKSRQGEVYLISTLKDSDFVLEETSPNNLIFISLIPFFLISLFLAERRNLDVDYPRNLAKAVTVE